MTLQPGNTTDDGEISRADLLPFLTSFRDLRHRAFLWPAIAASIFCAALLIFAAIDDAPGFFWCLASFISLTNLFLFYLWCGKKMPFPFVFLVAAAAFGVDYLLIKPIIAVESFLPAPIAPGIAEETAKAIPLVIVLLLGMLLSHPRQRKYGLREPLDGILLAAASATGFAFLETMFVYVPKYGAMVAIPRLMVNVFGHIAYAGVFGYFIGLAAMRHRRLMPVAIAILIGFGLANLLHDLWDTMRYYSGGLAIISPLHQVILAVLSFIVLASLIAKARDVSPEREFLWPYGSLMPYRAPHVEPLPVMPVLPGDIWLTIGGHRISLTETTHLTVRDIPCLTAPGRDGVIAEVREHPDDASLLVLRNLSKETWEAVMPDGGVREIEPAGTVRLLAGTRLDFGEQAGAILVTSTEIGADPRAHPAEEWC
ncbi:MAG TPA: PrsW family glutamic-type intramembrane protease [Stellaceae bacterium]|nr:PrsW family glutamic-type intramembrane protease [Stellaceae bacterium]